METTILFIPEDFNIVITKKYPLVLGNDVDGIADEILADLENCLVIQNLGTNHSLNVSDFGVIEMWELINGLK